MRVAFLSTGIAAARKRGFLGHGWTASSVSSGFVVVAHGLRLFVPEIEFVEGDGIGIACHLLGSPPRFLHGFHEYCGDNSRLEVAWVRRRVLGELDEMLDGEPCAYVALVGEMPLRPNRRPRVGRETWALVHDHNFEPDSQVQFRADDR
jgi:hypothetical protein